MAMILCGGLSFIALGVARMVTLLSSLTLGMARQISFPCRVKGPTLTRTGTLDPTGWPAVQVDPSVLGVPSHSVVSNTSKQKGTSIGWRTPMSFGSIGGWLHPARGRENLSPYLKSPPASGIERGAPAARVANILMSLCVQPRSWAPTGAPGSAGREAASTAAVIIHRVIDLHLSCKPADPEGGNPRDVCGREFTGKGRGWKGRVMKIQGAAASGLQTVP